MATLLPNPAPVDEFVDLWYIVPFSEHPWYIQEQLGRKGKHISAGIYSSCAFIMSEEGRDLKRFLMK